MLKLDITITIFHVQPVRPASHYLPSMWRRERLLFPSHSQEEDEPHISQYFLSFHDRNDKNGLKEKQVEHFILREFIFSRNMISITIIYCKQIELFCAIYQNLLPVHNAQLFLRMLQQDYDVLLYPSKFHWIVLYRNP